MKDSFQDKSPVTGKDVYIAPGSTVTGDVKLGRGASVWHGAVIRGDVWNIVIGEYSNIQDNCVCHITTGGPPLIVGNYVTVGHGAVLHSCTIGDGCLIGMNAVILDNVEVGEGSIVAAGSVLLEGIKIPSRSLVAGIPGEVKREISEQQAEKLFHQAERYHKLALSYLGKGEFNIP